MTSTEKYIEALTKLKIGDLGLLRFHIGKNLDQSLQGFDLFAGLWWPLRKENQRAPRREVAWLIAKLYAFRPIPHSTGEQLAGQLKKCQPSRDPDKVRFQERFDRLLIQSLDDIEPHIQWVLDLLNQKDLKLDWVKLTDDLSFWKQDSTRLRWAKEYLEITKQA